MYDATYLIAETVVSGRSMRLINGWGLRLTQKLANYAQQCVTESPLVAVGLPGLKIKDAKIENAQFFDRHRHQQKNGSSPSKGKLGGVRGQSVVQQVADQAKKVLKAKNGDDFFKSTEFGKKLKPYCESMRRKYKNNKMYKIKEGFNHSYLEEDDIIYFDSSHEDHLEVFRKRDGIYSQECVLDLYGDFNRVKTMQALSKNRRLYI